MNCPTCEQPVGELRDEASQKEAAFSGMCQNCQDDFFGPESVLEKVASVEKVAEIVECPTCEAEMEDTDPECPNGHPNENDYYSRGSGKTSKVAAVETNELPEWIQEAQLDLG